MEYRDLVLIKLWTGATTRLSKMGYTLPIQAKEVSVHHTWREVLHIVFQITFDESEYRVKLYKQNSTRMYNLNDKVSDMIQYKRANHSYGYHTVRLKIKHRGKKAGSRLSSPEDEDIGDDDNFSSESTPPPALTPHYPQREGSEGDEYNFGSDDDLLGERSANYLGHVFQKARDKYCGEVLRKEGASSSYPSPYPDWPTPRIDSFGSGEYFAYPCPTPTQNEASIEVSCKVPSNCLEDTISCFESENVEKSDIEESSSPTSTLKRKNDQEEDASCRQNTDEDDEHIRSFRELQAVQEMLSGQLATARELSGKLESEKFALIKASNAKYLNYERALCESRKKLEASDARILALEKEKEADKLFTLLKVKQTQEELKKVLVLYQDMAKKEMKFAEMQGEVLAMRKKYHEVCQELIEAKEKNEVEIGKVSSWVGIAQSLDPEVRTPQDLETFILENKAVTEALRGRNSYLGRRMLSFEGEVNGLKKDLNVAKGNETVLRTRIKELEQNLEIVSKERDDFKVTNEHNQKALEAVLSATLTAIPRFKSDVH